MGEDHVRSAQLARDGGADRGGGLVTTGPYALIRHPIYTAVCLFVVSGALAHLSLLSGLLGIIVVVGAVVRMVAEERLVLRRYPEYARRTPRMVPYVF